MEAALRKGERLDLGCVAAHGGFRHGKSGYEITEGDQPAAAFLFDRKATEDGNCADDRRSAGSDRGTHPAASC